MPYDVMSTMHEAGMQGSHHWLFWVVIVAAFAAAALLIWRLASRSRRIK